MNIRNGTHMSIVVTCNSWDRDGTTDMQSESIKFMTHDRPTTEQADSSQGREWLYWHRYYYRGRVGTHVISSSGAETVIHCCSCPMHLSGRGAFVAEGFFVVSFWFDWICNG